MRVIPPIAITPSLLTSTTVAEPDASETAYNGATIYKSGDQVISTSTHRTYESLSGTRSVVTITIASPGVVTWANHDLPAGTPIAFTTTGALPTGLTAGTVYFVLAPTASTFTLAATVGGTAINTSGSQSGVHTATGNPNIGRALTDEAWWADAKPTLRYAMFDLLRNTGTTDASPLTVEITPGERVDAIGLVGLVAETVEITVVAGSPPAEVYSYTLDLTTREVGGWYDFFFAPFDIQTALVMTDLPPFLSPVITVTLTGTGDVTCGALIIGRSVYLGEAQLSAESDALNFSVIERDAFGNSLLTPRRTIPKTSQEVFTEKSNVNRIRQVRDDLNAAPALWTALDDSTDGYFEAMLILGVYKRFTINLSYPQHAVVSLELEEV